MQANTNRAIMAIFIAAILACAFGACSGCHARAGATTPEQQEQPQHECPPCPPCPGAPDVFDPLAGSTIDDGFTDEERTAFIRKAVRATLRISITTHMCERGVVFGGGTGVAIRPNLILTAAHVVDQKRFYWGTQRRLARDNLSIVWPRATFFKVLVQKRDRDTALLQLTDGETMPYTMPLALGRQIKNGDLLWQFGRTTRWSRGPVIDASNPNRIGIRFTAAGGDSGGPVVWPDGHLAGITILRSLKPEHRVDENTSSVGYFVHIDQVIQSISEGLAGLR